VTGAAVNMSPVRLLVVRNDATDPPALLGQWWKEAGAEVVELLADAGDVLPTELPADVDALVLLGGDMAAWEDERATWLPDERALVAHTVAAGRPVLGVCLGAQVMTLALGGVVDRAPVAEIGVVEIDLLDAAADDPLLSRVPAGAPVAQYHRDAMLREPEGAVRLASTAECPVQAYRLGHHAWAVQFHPEVDAEIMRSWFGDDPAAAEGGVDPLAIVAEMTRRAEEMQDAWRPFAHAFVDVVRAASGRA
jgi:GMP synthase-like glutamine amidotransferase